MSCVIEIGVLCLMCGTISVGVRFGSNPKGVNCDVCVCSCVCKINWLPLVTRRHPHATESCVVGWCIVHSCSSVIPQI